MKTKLLTSALLAASLLAAPAVAFAKSETAAPETRSGATTPKATQLAMRPPHRWHHGTTTGMSSSKSRPGGHSVSGKPPGS